MNKLKFSQKIKLSLLLPFLKKTDKIIDLGCGDMWLTKYLRKKGYDCVGFALTKPADIVGDIKSYNFRKRQYDVVIALEMIEHVDCFSEIDSILKQNGILIVSTPVPHFDFFCRFLEKIGILQDRGTPHCNLMYLSQVPLPFKQIYRKILMGINQFGVFKKNKRKKGSNR